MKLSLIIKYVRDKSGLSQEDFANKIGVGRLAVTRWENNKAIPNKIAQAKIYEIVKENDISLVDYFIQDLAEHQVLNNKIILYHGSKSGIEGNIRPISRTKCDFGKGFYMGSQIHQPLTLIYSFEKSSIYIVELDLSDLNVIRIPVGLEWAMLVAYSRGKLDRIIGTALYEKYKKLFDGVDVLIGSIANDRMFYVLDRFFMGDITDKGLVESLSALQLGEQYVALTQKACNQIKILEYRVISELERLCLHDMSEQNRKYGIETANDICRNNRREGRFFDEILEQGE